MVCVYSPRGEIVATLDDTHVAPEHRRDGVTLLRQGVAMAEAMERLEREGGMLAVEKREEGSRERVSSGGRPQPKPVALSAIRAARLGALAEPFAGALLLGVPPHRL